MKSISGKAFVRVLERRGWTLLRIKGSHHIYGKSGIPVGLSVPIHIDESNAAPHTEMGLKCFKIETE